MIDRERNLANQCFHKRLTEKNRPHGETGDGVEDQCRNQCVDRIRNVSIFETSEENRPRSEQCVYHADNPCPDSYTRRDGIMKKNGEKAEQESGEKSVVLSYRNHRGQEGLDIGWSEWKKPETEVHAPD